MVVEVEVVKQVDGKIVMDEVFGLVLCPKCELDVIDYYNYCPHCGCEMPRNS